MREWCRGPDFAIKVHTALTVMWILLIVPSVTLWKDSVLWVIVISIWANVASHYATVQAAKAQKQEMSGLDNEDLAEKIDKVVTMLNGVVYKAVE